MNNASGNNTEIRKNGMKFTTLTMYAPKPDWWSGTERYNSEDDLIDVAIGPLEVEHQGRPIWLDFTSSYLEVEAEDDHIVVGLTLHDLNEWGTTELNGFEVNTDLLRSICEDEGTRVKTVNCAEILHLDMQLAQFDGLELARCKMATDKLKVYKKNIEGAQLQC